MYFQALNRLETGFSRRPGHGRLPGHHDAPVRRAARLVAAMILALSCWSLIPDATAADSSPSPAMSGSQKELARKIKAEIMAPCCWNGTVDNHESPIAHQIAADIDRRVASGETEDQIVNRLVDQYGERILARPRTHGLGLLFYILPLIILILTGLGLALWMSKSARGAATETAEESGVPAKPTKGRSSDLDARFEEELRRLQER